MKIFYASTITIHLNTDSLEESLNELISIFYKHDLPVLHEGEGLLSLRVKSTPYIAKLLESKGFSLNQTAKAWIFSGCHI